MGALDHADALAAFTEQAEALAAGGVDLLWIETMSSFEEVSAAIEAASAVACLLHTECQLTRRRAR